jgi:hypothetical protein
MGPSAAEQQLQTEQAAETAQYMGQQSTLYGESQALQATLTPLLESEINNPTGFSASELSELNASNVNTTGAQYANVQKQLNLQNSSANMAGLTSGVAAGESASLKSLAAGTVASNASNIQLQSAQLAQQKQQTAQSELLGLESGQAGEAISEGQVENQSESQSFNQAYQEQQQSSQLMNTVLGGVIGAGSAFATGGASMIGCWIAAEVYGGWDAPEIARVRQFIFEDWAKRSLYGRFVARLYMAHGERVAGWVRKSRILKFAFRLAFDRIK